MINGPATAAKIVLIDLDGVLADFASGFANEWNRNMGAVFPALAHKHRQHFYIKDDYPPALQHHVDALLQTPGFYRQLPCMPGAVEALARLEAAGHPLWICTTAPSTGIQEISEKLQWIDAQFGDKYVQRTIITPDKTMIHAQILIDDRPHLCGSSAIR